MKIDKYFLDKRVLLKHKIYYTSLNSGILRDVTEEYFSVQWDNSTSMCWHKISDYEIIEQLEQRNYHGS